MGLENDDEIETEGVVSDTEIETDDLDVSDDEVEAEDTEGEPADDADETEEAGEETGDDDAPEDDEGEVVISIDGEEPEDDDDKKTEDLPDWVKELRRENRKRNKENRELRKQLEEKKATQEKIVLGDKPKLSDFDYDEDDYDKALTKWYGDKRKFDEQEAQKEQLAKDQQDNWDNAVESYGTQKTELGVKDFDDVEEDVAGSLSEIQTSIIIAATDKPAALIYAIGKNKGTLKKLSDIKDPVKFAVAIGRLEGKIKMTTRKKAPPPEKRVKGSGGKPVSGASDNKLERLRTEAAKSGDMSKVIAYKRNLRKKAS